MNWTAIMVVSVLVVMIPCALFAMFTYSKDTHQYAQHYSDRGFSPEIVDDVVSAKGTAGAENPLDPPAVEIPLSQPAEQAFQPPVIDWPTDL